MSTKGHVGYIRSMICLHFFFCSMCSLFPYTTVCASIQVTALSSLEANQVEHLNHVPATHVDNLLGANEAEYGEWAGQE